MRCKKDFPKSKLKGVPKALLVLAIPFFFWMLFKSRVLRQELTSTYCPPCRRQLNACLFFCAFMLFFALMMTLMKWLGIS